jgi:hypothetical protein
MMLQNTYSITTCRQQHVNLVSEGPINPCAAAASALPNAVRSPITSSKSASLVDPSPFRNHLTHAFTHYSLHTQNTGATSIYPQLTLAQRQQLAFT